MPDIYGVRKSLLTTSLNLNSIPGYTFDLSADVGVTLDGSGNVSDVANQAFATGSGYNVTTSGSTARPAWIPSAYNGRATMRFDGINDTLLFSGAGLGFANNIPGATLFMAGKFNLLSAALVLTRWSVNASTADRLYVGIAASNRLQIAARRLDADSSSYRTSGINEDGTFGFFTFWWDLQNASVRIWKNGTVVLGATSFQTSGNSQASNSLQASIASSNSAAYFSGDISREIGFQRALSFAEINAINNSVGAGYYGLPITQI